MKNAAKIKKDASTSSGKYDSSLISPNGVALIPPSYGISWMSQQSIQDSLGVSIHANSSQAVKINAQAFTKGRDIHFAPGKYNPNTRKGKELLGHELAHVEQQRKGKAKSNDLFNGLSGNTDTHLEKQADQQGKLFGQGKDIFSTDNAHSNIPSFFSTIQRKKTEGDKPEEFRTLVDFNKDPKLTDKEDAPKIVEAEEPGQAEINTVWNHLNDAYDKMKSKGDEYWKAHLKSVERYKDTEQKEGLISELGKKQQILDAKFQKNYVTSKPNFYDGKYKIQSKGKVPKQGEVDEDSVDNWNYNNKVDLEDKIIIASVNYATKDPARIADSKKAEEEKRKLSLEEKLGLPNSEILWQQYREVAKFHHKADSNDDEAVVQSLKNINQITRAQVSNLTTLKVAYIADENQPPKYFNPPKTWTPENEEFKALLGTPNVKSAVFLLNDHMDQLGKTIESIKTVHLGFFSGGNQIEIKYKNLPK